MKLKRIAVKNIKKIESLDIDLNGNVFAIAGDNEVGKSTLLQLILQSMTLKNKIPVPVTQGKKDGFALFEFEAPGGMPYQVKLEYKEDGKEKLTLMAPGGIKSTKVTDLRNVFDYHDVSVEEFMLWSDSKEGRMKQRNLLLSIFPKEIQEKFISAIEKETLYYNNRASLNKEVDLLTKQLEGYKMTEEELLQLQNKATYQSRLNQANEYKKKATESYTNIKVLESKIEQDIIGLEQYKSSLTNQKAQLKKQIDDKHDEINELKAKLQKLEQEAFDLIEQSENFDQNANKEIDRRNATIKSYHDQVAVIKADLLPEDKVETSITTLKARIDALATLETRNNMRLEIVKQLEAKTASLKVAEKDLTDIRNYKDQVILEAEMPIQGLSIDENGLNYNGLPFDKNQLSTSQFMQVVLRILIAINKKTPIIPIGRAESFGKKKLNELIELAEKENCQIFFEKVKDEGSLTIEVFEDDEFHPIEQKAIVEEPEKKKKGKELPADWRESIKKEEKPEDLFAEEEEDLFPDETAMNYPETLFDEI